MTIEKEIELILSRCTVEKNHKQSNYFDAIGHAVRCAIEAMEVKNHG